MLGGQAVRISTEIRKITCQLSVYLLEYTAYIEEVGLINSYVASSRQGHSQNISSVLRQRWRGVDDEAVSQCVV